MSQDPPSVLTEKVGGLMLLVASVALAKVALIDPLAAARDGAGEVTTLGSGVVFMPAMLVLGVGLLFFPRNTVWNLLSRPTLRDPDTQRLTMRGWGLLAAVLVPGIALFAWQRWTLSRHGYH